MACLAFELRLWKVYFVSFLLLFTLRLVWDYKITFIYMNYTPLTYKLRFYANAGKQLKLLHWLSCHSAKIYAKD